MVGGADVAACTLTDHALAAALGGVPRLAVAAPLATANLGIEQLVLAMVSAPGLGHLVVCGRDSPVFRQGQSLLALAANGCRGDGTIVGATGYRARVANLRPRVVAEFRRRVAVHDLVGVRDREVLAAAVADLPRHAEEPALDLAAELAASVARLHRVPAGGARPPNTDDDGYFVVSIDPAARRIVVRHYDTDLRGGREMSGRSAQALVLGLVRAGLLTDPAHAGYLGAELAKAELALRFDFQYRQDHPLTRPTGCSQSVSAQRTPPDTAGTGRDAEDVMEQRQRAAPGGLEWG
ncbi:hypothetical protein [Dactylosporangium sp. NPDC049140]|uniref:DUF4346 domain-containing protein n=1 Tax=Dactylosporangium sp. NPDC049140 TaxID=3155647 RepID=UPI0033DC04D7